jgi:hypothetical protein
MDIDRCGMGAARERRYLHLRANSGGETQPPAALAGG